MLTSVSLHENVRRLREAAQLSRRELDEQAGVPSRTVERVELRKHRPNYETLSKIAAALGVDVGVLDGANEPPLQGAVDRLVTRHGARAVLDAAVDAALPKKV